MPERSGSELHVSRRISQQNHMSIGHVDVSASSFHLTGAEKSVAERHVSRRISQQNHMSMQGALSFFFPY